jgi:hypothetical protein
LNELIFGEKFNVTQLSISLPMQKQTLKRNSRFWDRLGVFSIDFPRMADFG